MGAVTADSCLGHSFFCCRWMSTCMHPEVGVPTCDLFHVAAHPNLRALHPVGTPRQLSLCLRSAPWATL